MSDNSSEFGAFLAGFVIGSLVGAATALILAPQSGAQTRGQITSKSQELRESGEQRLNEYRDLSTEKVQDYQSRAASLLHRDTGEEETAIDQARIVLDEGTDQIATVIDETIFPGEGNIN